MWVCALTRADDEVVPYEAPLEREQRCHKFKGEGRFVGRGFLW